VQERLSSGLRMTARTSNGNGEIRGSLHCVADERVSATSVEMTFFFLGAFR
jgi:hypothetical protein